MILSVQKLYIWGDEGDRHGEWIGIATSPSKRHLDEAIDSFLWRIEELTNDSSDYKGEAIIYLRLIQHTTGGNREAQP